jgi:hypothetical protein
MGATARQVARQAFDTAAVCGDYEALFLELAREARARSR